MLPIPEIPPPLDRATRAAKGYHLSRCDVTLSGGAGFIAPGRREGRRPGLATAGRAIDRDGVGNTLGLLSIAPILLDYNQSIGYNNLAHRQRPGCVCPFLCIKEPPSD